jgi:hypothetical protein
LASSVIRIDSCGFVVLRLREQVGGDPVRVAGLVGDDQDLGGSGDHVDADLAEHDALGRRHIGVAGTHDLGDRLDARCPIGECGHRLRAADAIDLVDACELRRRQHQRVELSVRRRHHHDDARHARDFRGHRVHEDRGRISRGAARHVKPDCLDRGPAAAEFDAERVGEALVLGQLANVIGLDPAAGERKRVERFGIAGFRGRGDLLAADAQADATEIDPIEAPAEVNQRGVAPLDHVIDDATRGCVDIGGDFALGAEKSVELLEKIAGG